MGVFFLLLGHCRRFWMVNYHDPLVSFLFILLVPSECCFHITSWIFCCMTQLSGMAYRHRDRCDKAVDTVSALRCRQLSCRCTFVALPQSSNVWLTICANTTQHRRLQLRLSDSFFLASLPPTSPASTQCVLHGSSLLKASSYPSTGSLSSPSLSRVCHLPALGKPGAYTHS